MSIWINRQQTNYNKKNYSMSDPNICKKWEEFVDKYKKHFMSNEEQWNGILERVAHYIDQNDKRPLESDKCNDIQQMSIWINRQQTNYNKKNYSMSDPNICKKWEEFIFKYQKHFISKNEEQWNIKLELVAQYIEQNDNRPSHHDKSNEIKQMGNWIGEQIKKYKKKTNIMSDPNICKKWEEFIDKYQKHFMSNEEQWNIMLERVSHYIDQNDKRPAQSDKCNNIQQMGNWIASQQINYNKKNNIMSDLNICKKWEDFIDKYQKHFMSNEERWNGMLEQVTQYIEKNDKRPNTCDKDSEIKQMGMWISDYQLRYRKKTQIMSDPNIRKKWEKFIDKYKKHFMSNEEHWNGMMERVKQYIDTNNKIPSYSDKDSNIKKLVQWIGTQKKNYKNKEQIMTNQEIYNKWTEFINDERYILYFQSNKKQ
jgi:hypothetical protein